MKERQHSDVILNLLLHPTNDQISSTFTRLAATLRSARSWYSVQAVPTLTSRRRTAPFDTPVIRTVERTEQPSTSAEITAIFFAMLITFGIIQVYDSAFA